MIQLRVIGQLTIRKNIISLIAEENVTVPVTGREIKKGDIVTTVRRTTYSRMKKPLKVNISLNWHFKEIYSFIKT